MSYNDFDSNNNNNENWRSKSRRPPMPKERRPEQGERQPFRKKPEENFTSSGLDCYTIILDKDTPDYIVTDLIETRAIYGMEKAGLRLRIGIPEKDGTSLDALVNETTRKQYMLPWKGFDDKPTDDVYGYTTQEAIKIFKQSTMAELPKGVYPIAALKVNLLLGRSCDNPSKFVLIWTPDAATSIADISKDTGWLASVIKLAEQNKIPVYNLNTSTAWSMLDKFTQE